MEQKTKQQVACPDCGQAFSARGLSGHRRMRHGLRPAPALPRETNRAVEGISSIMNALAGLQDSVERIELHMAAWQNPLAKAETPEAEIARLNRELAELLQHIERMKRTGLASTTIRLASSESAQRSTFELAQLRRNQARLVFRLEELRHGVPSDERFLS